MISVLRNWFRGLSLLRHPEVVAGLGEERLRRRRIEDLRRECPGARISDRVVLVDAGPGVFRAAPGSSVGPGTILAFSADPPSGAGAIVVGEGSWIGEYNNLRVCARSRIVIGRNCLVSQFCTLIGSNHGRAPGRPMRDQPCDDSRLGVTLGDDVWLGAGVTVLPGVTVGDGAVVGANSVVARDVPPGEIWAGSPAVRVGSRA